MSMFFQQVIDALANLFGRYLVEFGQLVPHRRGQGESTFKIQAGVQQAASQDAAQEGDPGLVLAVENDRFHSAPLFDVPAAAVTGHCNNFAPGSFLRADSGSGYGIFSS